MSDTTSATSPRILPTLMWAENLIGLCALIIVAFAPSLIAVTLYSRGYSSEILTRLLIVQAIVFIPEIWLIARAAALLHQRVPELVVRLAGSFSVPLWLRPPVACWWLCHAIASVWLASFAAEHCLIRRPKFIDEIVIYWTVAGFLNLGGGYASVLFLILLVRAGGAGERAAGVLWRFRFVIDLLLAIGATLLIARASLF